MHSSASKSSAALLAAAVLLSTGTVLGKPSNLIKNGGFDVGPQPSYFTTFPKGSTAISGWIVTMGTVDVIGPNWHDADGGKNSIDVDGTPGPGAIAQSFATTRGAKYTVSFALAGNPECAPTIKRLWVTAGNASRRYSFDASHTSDAHMGWQPKSFTFTAAGVRSTLTFTSLDPKGSLCGPAIDAVRVARIARGAPSPVVYNLAGTWSATYPGGPLPVRITQTGTRMSGVLLRGNKYVPAGKVEIRGNVTGRVFHGQQLCAFEGFVDARWVNTTITIADSRHFTSTITSSFCSGVDYFTRVH